MLSLGTSDLIERIDYSEYTNKQLITLPLALFILSVGVLLGGLILSGTPVGLGIEFVGGSEIQVESIDGTGSTSELATVFPVEPTSVQTVLSDGSYVVTFKESGQDISELEIAAEQAGYEVLTSSDIAASFGSETQRLALVGMGVAFGGMALVVFGLFRTFIPSIAVIASATSDITVTVAAMAILGVDLSLGTVAALLMLIGYSVDSDILLNDYVIRRGGEFYESVYAAMDTGVTMTLTSLLAMVVLALGAAVLGVSLLQDIGAVLAIGLAVDLLNTYMLNLSLLRWYKFDGVRR